MKPLLEKVGGTLVKWRKLLWGALENTTIVTQPPAKKSPVSFSNAFTVSLNYIPKKSGLQVYSLRTRSNVPEL